MNTKNGSNSRHEPTGFSTGISRDKHQQASRLKPLLSALLVAGAALCGTAACSILSPKAAAQRFEVDAQGKVFEHVVRADKDCTYQIGILFRALDGNSQTILGTFGSPPALRLPADIDVVLQDAEGKTVLSKNLSSANVLASAYGPNPVRFYAGFIPLRQGPYLVRVVAHRLPDLSLFKVEFFMQRNPKSTCGKQH